jgi:8-oxo-dGTP pyrophosphatase MutT (NUDIX family)
MDEQLTHAGGVVFRPQDDGNLFLVVSSSDGRNWVLPKGHIEPGETSAAAALREVAEEAGVIGQILKPLSVQSFLKANKQVAAQYFLIREVGSTHTQENRTIRWENEVTSLTLLTFPEAKTALLEGIAALRQENNDEDR